MIGLWLAAGAVTVLATLPLIWALVRTPAASSRADRSTLLLAQLKAQLAEVDREVERGVIKAAEAEGLRVEIRRRMLSAADDADLSVATTAPPRAGVRRSLTAAGLAVTVAAASFALYLVLGSPGVPDQPLAARQDAKAVASASAPSTHAAEMRKFQQAVAALEQRLAEHPEDVRGWSVLGGAYRSEQRYADAARAFGEAYDRSGNDPAIAADLAEARIAASGGRVDEQSQPLLQQALAFDPRDARARFYLALGQAQGGDVAAALQGWVDLLALVPPDAPFVPVVRQHIAQAATVLNVDPNGVAPSAEARNLAATSPEAQAAQQSTMIRQMVDRLADRLAREPNDRDGWLKLARAYDVLGEAAKAAEARDRAAALPETAPPAAPR